MARSLPVEWWGAGGGRVHAQPAQPAPRGRRLPSAVLARKRAGWAGEGSQVVVEAYGQSSSSTSSPSSCFSTLFESSHSHTHTGRAGEVSGMGRNETYYQGEGGRGTDGRTIRHYLVAGAVLNSKCLHRLLQCCRVVVSCVVVLLWGCVIV